MAAASRARRLLVHGGQRDPKVQLRALVAQHDLFEHGANQRLPLVEAHLVQIRADGSCEALDAIQEVSLAHVTASLGLEILDVRFEPVHSLFELSGSFFELVLAQETRLVCVQEPASFSHRLAQPSLRRLKLLV